MRGMFKATEVENSSSQPALKLFIVAVGGIAWEQCDVLTITGCLIVCEGICIACKKNHGKLRRLQDKLTVLKPTKKLEKSLEFRDSPYYAYFIGTSFACFVFQTPSSSLCMTGKANSILLEI